MAISSAFCSDGSPLHEITPFNAFKWRRGLPERKARWSLNGIAQGRITEAGIGWAIRKRGSGGAAPWKIFEN